MASQQSWSPPPGPAVQWTPQYLQPPRRLDVNYVVLVGAILVFFGYLLFFISGLILVGLTGTSPTREQVVITADIGIAGEIVVGTGFLVALLGLAIKR